MNPEPEKSVELLLGWLASRLDDRAMAWVREQLAFVQAGDKKKFYIAFGLTPRKVGKADLALTAGELASAASVRPGWNPRGWSVDQVVRTVFVLSYPNQDAAAYVATLDQLFGTGEVGELVALYQALPLFPRPQDHVLRAAEGIRTNIKAVFCAVAHQNPFPAEQFNEDQWNQMVLKCQFIGVPMAPIVGFDQRANACLSRMVVDFIHERRAAKREVPAEMWRCVGKYADARGLEELKQLLTTGAPTDRQAAALALSECQDPAATAVLKLAPELQAQVAAGAISWSNLVG